MVLLDGNSIAARCFYGTHYDVEQLDAELFTSSFLKSLIKILTDMSQWNTSAIFCVDSSSWRKKFYPLYKANRHTEPKARALHNAYNDCFMDLCAEMKGFMPLAIIRREPYEADDLIAYYSDKYDQTFIVSTDKDFGQLVDGIKINFWNFAEEKFVKIPNKQYYLHEHICLGDSTDNVPSITPRNDQNKTLFQFGEKTVEAQYDPNSPTTKFINQEFIHELQTKPRGKEKRVMTPDIILELYENYERNKRLIDLTQSPVWGEDLPLAPVVTYQEHLCFSFFRDNLGRQYINHERRIQELLTHYGRIYADS